MNWRAHITSKPVISWISNYWKCRFHSDSHSATSAVSDIKVLLRLRTTQVGWYLQYFKIPWWLLLLTIAHAGWGPQRAAAAALVTLAIWRTTTHNEFAKNSIILYSEARKFRRQTSAYNGQQDTLGEVTWWVNWRTLFWCHYCYIVCDRSGPKGRSRPGHSIIFVSATEGSFRRCYCPVVPCRTRVVAPAGRRFRFGGTLFMHHMICLM